MFLFVVIALIMSATFHEYMHGFAANQLGDPTAKNAGRLSLNPIKHLDLVGSVLIPLFLVIMQSPFLFGWAKPVPFNPYNLRNRKWGEAIVAAAGPGINIVIALVFGLILRFGASAMPVPAVFIVEMITLINILLAIFNLVPIPPLDGSKILFALLPPSAANVRRIMEQYSTFLVLFFILVLWSYVFPLVILVFSWITGMSLA